MHNFKDYLNFSPNAADNAYRLRQLALQEALLAEAKKKKAKKDSKKSKDADEKDEKAGKDYDGDGTVESGKEEYFGSRDKAIKKAISKKKGNLKETNSGKMTYGGFPKVINEVKAETLINTTLELSTRLNRSNLRRDKYNLIKEIKAQYDIEEFFKAKINNYTQLAAVYNILSPATGGVTVVIVEL
jgi:hypothetical protein